MLYYRMSRTPSGPGRFRTGLALISTLFLVGVSAPAAALDGSAVSAPDTLDSLPPLVQVVRPGGGETFLAAAAETLRWTIDENSWDLAAEPVALQIVDGGDVILQDTVAPDPDGTYVYVWTVPLGVETTTARFEVAATDRFGWPGDAAGDDFNIEDHVSDVPPPPLVDRLGPVWPNPFNPSANIAFSLRAAGNVELSIFDVRGRKVVTLIEGAQTAGQHTAVWQGRNAAGQTMPSGTYFARLILADASRLADGRLVTRLTLVK